MDAEETVPIAVKSAHSDRLAGSLELWLRSPDGKVRVYPFCRTLMMVGPATRGKADLELSAGPWISLSWNEGKVSYCNETPLEDVLCNGEACVRGELSVGATLELGQYQLQLWDREGVPAYLEGYCEPFLGTLWPLALGLHPLGRGGSRANSITVDHPTVSRAHACLTLTHDGATVQAESQTNPVTLNGCELARGEGHEIHDGDLLEIGELLFRFHRPVRRGRGESPASVPPLNLALLGGFQVELGGKVLPDKLWRTQHIKWLTARLAYAWDTPLDVEAAIDLAWPEASLDKGRKNLNFAVYVLRSIFRGASGCGADYLSRSSRTLGLNAEYLGESDIQALDRCLQRGEWQQALDLYRGAFLEGCYLDWAVRLREHYHLRVVEAGRKVLDLKSQVQDWEGVLQVGGRILIWDPCCQLTYQAMMGAHISRRQPVEALRLYETCVRQLRQELAIEPSIEILREYHRCQALL